MKILNIPQYQEKYFDHQINGKLVYYNTNIYNLKTYKYKISLDLLISLIFTRTLYISIPTTNPSNINIKETDIINKTKEKFIYIWGKIKKIKNIKIKIYYK